VPGQPDQAKSESTLDSAGATHCGRVRKTNEDAFVIAVLQRSLLIQDANPAAGGWFAGNSAGTLLVVADGMGGQGGGDVASKVAIQTVVNHLLNCMPWAPRRPAKGAGRGASLSGVREELATAMVEGDATVKTAGAQTSTPRMGTTLTMALVLGPIAYVAHVGDSRAYLLRGGQLRRLTRDHTLAQKLAEESHEPIDPESQLNHILWNSLGASDEVPEPEIQKLILEASDVLLLCSDGLTKHLTDPQIANVLGMRAPASERCAMLIESANSAGGTDNTTVVVAQAR
jgi:PPM family protein phosphatase